MREKTEEILLETGMTPVSLDDKQIEQDGKYNVATLPQSEDMNEEIPKNAFLPKRTEAIMMTALCIALFGEFFVISVVRLRNAYMFTLTVAGWNDASTGPLIPSLQNLYHVSCPTCSPFPAAPG